MPYIVQSHFKASFLEMRGYLPPYPPLAQLQSSSGAKIIDVGAGGHWDTCPQTGASLPGGRGAMAHPRIQNVGFFGNFKVSSENH